MMRNECLAALLILLISWPALAKDPPAAASGDRSAPPGPAFDGRRAMAIVSEIAGDAYAGRKSGLPSGQRAEEYAAGQFAAWGLEPAGEHGTYFQSLAMLTTEERGADLELLDSPYGAVPFLYGDDFALVTNSGTGDVTAEVVLAGHGLCSPRREWDDYGDLDVRGRIVLIVRGTPDNGYDWEQAGARDSTLHEAMRRGAAAVLYNQGPRAVHGGAVHDGSYFPQTPVAYIGHRALELLLMNTGYSRERYEKELAERPVPLPTGKRVRIRTDVVRIPDAHGRNVLACLPGADERLRDEIIVIGAHLDHLGTDGRGLVYNGANDNGSGAAVVMELARSLMASARRPARTIVFANFAGEEQGLLGSEAVVAHPTIDLERAVAMINLDMVGHGNGRVGIGGGEFYPDVWAAFRAGLDAGLADSLKTGRAWGGEGSDHAPFRRAGVPVGNIWSEGDHRFYHSIQDDPDWIDARVLGSVGRMAERWIRALADWPAPLACAHRAGRSLLYASTQIDLDGALRPPVPDFVCAQVRWYGAELFGRGAFLDALADAQSRAAKGDTLALASSLGGIEDAVWGHQRACLFGLDHARGRVAPERLSLLGDLHVALARWPVGAPGVASAAAAAGPRNGASAPDAPGAPDAAYAAQLAGQGVTWLVPADTAVVGSVPAGGKACVRIFPQRGERLADPDRIPRHKRLFIVSLEGETAPRALAETLRRLGWDRVHLDLVPWISRGGEREIWAFLEELQTAGRFETRQMRSMLGGNLNRM
jgi:hypothetical protein